MKVYHYAHLRKWQDIQKGSWKTDNRPGLSAGRRVGQRDKEAWKTMAVFAFLEPLPDSWVNNTCFKGVWMDRFRSNIGSLLLELDVDLEGGEIFVVDNGHMEGFIYQKETGIPKKYLHRSNEEAERAYMESKISLKDYLEKAEDLGYSMPEIIILKDVPMERIRISDQQPLIEEDLEKYGEGSFKRDLISDIQRIPELSRWFEKREQGLRERLEGRNR
ncbi:MAG: hypothetical protein UX09_C0025G0004 [Candidatus Uhrbacteria bacterium GW2011_GWE2_45_35]|uniref:Uncharacterized protein n=2 Tax=Candidatus Uhriibacteriota TaxID=1752732 RepID=A0A0G1LKT6_9BACT|nr:MAG: hypothetical protein UW63_C0060G0004 [Candidatus Uhrbacteria bacterium GW2011_GWF2_44_350]KKU07714.1 MAG: hypothetical protein UX09_C0025G0004 [Candidatus Uhrbacteria bacterium GW2011_GWE2_45_35]